MYRSILFLLILGAIFPAAGSGRAQEGEQDRVFVIIDKDEIRAFSSSRSQWIPLNLKFDERVKDHRSSGNVAIVVTNQRVLGFSEITGQWSGVDLKMDETFSGFLEVSDNIGSVVTSERALGFSAQSGSWDATDLENK